MFKFGLLCCLLVSCLAKEKRILLFGDSGSGGTGLSGGSGNGLTGGTGLLGGGGLMSSLPGLSSSGSTGGFFLGSYTNLLQQTTKYWTDLMSKLLHVGGSSTSSGGGLTLPGLSGGSLPGLSGLPGLGGSGSSSGSLPTQATALRKKYL